MESKKQRNTGPSANDRIDKTPTSAAEGADQAAFDIGGNVRERGEDPSPDDRDRGERSQAEPAGGEDRRA